VYVLDFMQNIAGWVRIRVRGAANTTVQLRHAELLMHPPYVCNIRRKWPPVFPLPPPPPTPLSFSCTASGSLVHACLAPVPSVATCV